MHELMIAFKNSNSELTQDHTALNFHFAARNLVRTMGLLFTVLASIGSLGCTKKAADDPHTLFVGISAAPATLDPRFATDAVGMRLGSLLFSSIVRVGPELDIIGEAAASWKYDKLTYTFQLRPGLSFPGPKGDRPLTQDDLLYTFAQAQADKSPFASALKSISKVEATYDAKTGGELKLKLSQFSATLLTDLSTVKILPKDVVEAAGDDFGKKPIGSGPFEFVSADANEIRLKARAAHAYATPQVPQVVFKIVREDNTRFLKFIKGELDLIQQDLPPAKISEIEKRGGFQVFKYPGLSMTYILVNLQDPLLKSREVREAISSALHREEIIRFKLESLAQPATSILSPANPFHDVALAPPKFDLDHAKSVLKKANASGAELTLKTSNSTQAVENGKVLSHQLDQAGMKTKLQSFEWGTFYDDIKKGNFQLATMKWVGTTDPDIYRSAFHSKEKPPGGKNRGGYVNAELDQLVEKGLQIEDHAKRVAHYKKVQRMIYEDLAIIPLWYEFEVAVVSPKVEGFSPSKNGDFSALTKLRKR
jgi:peptide/nickel transport system substrate-binding protein